MNNSQQQENERERQRLNQYQHPRAAAPDNIFTNIYNVIAGARESASQEFTRFWESLGHAQRPYYYSSSSPTIQERKIKTPTVLRNKQFSRNSSINGRFLPDENMRGIVKDVEIQTDDDLLQPTSLSIPNKRSASSTFEEYHIPFPVKKSAKKTSFSLAEFERPAFLSRRMETTSNEDFSNQLQKEEPSEQQKQQQQQQEEQEATFVSNQDKESSPPPAAAPPSPSPPPPPPPAQTSLSPKRMPMRKAMSLSPNRPLSTSTSRAAAASVGRFTPSPNRDIRTGSKSVRRLTMELESQFSPKFPSPYSPKRQRQESNQETTEASSSSPQNDKQGESSLSPASHYRSELAATLATQAQAASATMITHSLPIKSFQPSPKTPEAAEEQQTTPNKEEEDYYANLLKQKELDERVNKLEKKVSIARTRVSEFSAENSGSDSNDNSHITSPTPSHTILSPSRPSISSAPAIQTHKTANSNNNNNKSPVRDTRVSTSPYRSSTLVSSSSSTLQQSTKEASFSPPSLSYAAAKAAIQEAVSRKSSASPIGERISSVRSTMSRPLTPVQLPPPAPPQPPQSASLSSPSRVSLASTSYYPPKHTPSPYLQPSSSNGITQLKPNDQHKSKMKEVIKMIPHFNLRRADTIIGPDGVSRPNPIWLDIYDPKKRRLYDQGAL